MDWLYSLLVLCRDLAVLAAAIGIAWWAWDRYGTAERRRDEEASGRMAAERRDADARRSAAALEALAGQISSRLDELAHSARQTESRSRDMARVHRLLHETKEPFLTFTEIRDGLVPPPDEDALRRALMELAADGVIAQLEGDRFFIASDYDADEAERT